MIYDMKEQPAADKYRGCGSAWVAINDGKIVDLRYMGDHVGTLTRYSAEAIALAGRVRPCPASEQAACDYNAMKFAAWRTESRSELAARGAVVSGMMSCGEFIPKIRRGKKTRNDAYINRPEFKSEMARGDAMVMEAKEKVSEN